MNKAGREKHSLLLVRTPFQAWVAQKVLASEGLKSYDLLYFTHNDSDEDRHYFSQLAETASSSRYCWAPTRRFDILGHLVFHRQASPWKHRCSYDQVLMASINSPVLNALATYHAASALITFDDGLANIVPDGMYQQDITGWRTRLYRRMLGAVPLALLKQRIERHYSIYPGFDNIVDPSRVRPLEAWRRKDSAWSAEEKAVSYFIGQPFQEVMSVAQIEQLRQRLKAMKIDFYVRHPREREILDIGTVPIEKHGRIAEEAILQHAQGRPIQLIGWFSTVLFNMVNMVERSTTFLVQAAPETPQREAMARKAGCVVEYV